MPRSARFSTTDPDAGDTFTYTLVAGTGVGRQRRRSTSSATACAPTPSFNFEAESSYTVRIRTTDAGGLFYEKAFTITVTNVNETPTDIALTNSTIAENAGANAAVGTLTHDRSRCRRHVHLHPGRRHRLDRQRRLQDRRQRPARQRARSTSRPDSSYTVRVRTHRCRRPVLRGGLHHHGHQRQRDADRHRPVQRAAIAENAGANAAVGTLQTTDPDAGDTFTYTLVAGTGVDRQRRLQHPRQQPARQRLVRLRGRELLHVRIRTTDAGGLFFEKAFTITVTNVNETPTCASPQSGTTAEDVDLNDNLLCTDVDGDSLTYSLVANAANGDVTVNPDGSFTYDPNLNFNGSDSFTFQASDGSLDSNVAFFNITVTAVNDAPTCHRSESGTTAEDTDLDWQPWCAPTSTATA